MLRCQESRLKPKDGETVYNTLLALESALIDFRRDYASLAESSQRQDSAAGVPALTRLCSTIKAIASAVRTLKQHTIEEDRARDRGPARSLGDLALRATALLVAALLLQLQRELARVPDKARRLFDGQLRTLDELIAFVLGPFEEASRLWNPFAADSSSGAPRDVEHHRVLREVRASIAAMANAPALCDVLQVGLKSLDWPALGRVCAQLSVVLRLDMEAAPGAPSFDITTSEPFHEMTQASYEP